MTGEPLQSLYGFQIQVNGNLCCLEFAGWPRHRKSRIRKKWRRKYGPVMRCKGFALRVMDKLHCCPCVAKQLNKLQRKES